MILAGPEHLDLPRNGCLPCRALTYARRACAAIREHALSSPLVQARAAAFRKPGKAVSRTPARTGPRQSGCPSKLPIASIHVVLPDGSG
jgi:hypothetical protein